MFQKKKGKNRAKEYNRRKINFARDVKHVGDVNVDENEEDAEEKENLQPSEYMNK